MAPRDGTFKSLPWVGVSKNILLSENTTEKIKLLLWLVTLFSNCHPFIFMFAWLYISTMYKINRVTKSICWLYQKYSTYAWTTLFHSLMSYVYIPELMRTFSLFLTYNLDTTVHWSITVISVPPIQKGLG